MRIRNEKYEAVAATEGIRHLSVTAYSVHPVSILCVVGDC